MLTQPYQPAEMDFAYCYHVYFRWRTLRRRPCPPLAQLSRDELQKIADRFGIHILELNTDPIDLLVLVSLQPTESVSACASKLKGQLSKWLRECLGIPQPTDLLKSGYFACTSGKSTREQVEEYLSRQGEHHGYLDRPVPPSLVREFPASADVEGRLVAEHAVTALDFHCVFATWRRHGVFLRESAEAVATRWQELQFEQRFALRKVSFVPDHVHVAIRSHPAVAPGALAGVLMNAAQVLMFERFSDAVIRAKIERLWQPTAYVGSFGDLATPMIQRYIQDWSREE